MTASLTDPKIASSDHGSLGIDELELKARIGEILNRWPAVGLAVGVVRNGRLEFFYGRGVADIASNTPVTEDTVFRIASITKTFTAIAVMQLWEQGLVDLDAPDYLRAYKLIPAKASFRPATVRHLLTHTAGIPQVVRPRATDDAVDQLTQGADRGRHGCRPGSHRGEVRAVRTIGLLSDHVSTRSRRPTATWSNRDSRTGLPDHG